MKFINTNRLNALYDDFERQSHEQDFQSFVEASLDKGKPICLDAEAVKDVLERMCDEDYDYLLECEDDDLELWGHDYLKRINFFGRLLGEKEEITIQEIEADRKPLLADGEKESCDTVKHPEKLPKVATHVRAKAEARTAGVLANLNLKKKEQK